MGNQVSLIPKVNYEDIQMVVHQNIHVQHSTLLINTLPSSLQHCLIRTTIDERFEERTVNAFIQKNPHIMIIVYGKNSNDITILHKYEQLVKLGFTNVYIYTGGIFEWMLLYEVYGKELFKITRYEIDILRYRPKSVLMGGATKGAGSSEFGGYLKDGSSMMDDGEERADDDYHNDEERDIRINIPQQNNTSKTDNILIRWLFGD
jgi:hypothetical protein